MEASEPIDPGIWVERLQDQCKREAVEIRTNAETEAEEASAKALAEANGKIKERIAKLRELRDDLAERGARVDRDLTRAAEELKRRAATYSQQT